MKVYSKSTSICFAETSIPASILFMIAFLALLLSGCSDSGTGATGNGDDNNNNNNDNNEIGTEPTFANVQMIFQQNCASCHIGDRTSGVRLDGYNNVMESVGNQYGREVIQPGNAANSPLVDKIESGSPEFGSRMPEGGPFISTQRINQIKEWIDNGAENN